MIVKFINPTAVGNVSMSTKTTPIKDGIKSTSRSQGDAPAQSNGGASAGLGGKAPRVAIASLLPIASLLVASRERLENAYNMLKNAMAYVHDDVKYTRLEGVRRRMVEAMLLINEAIDEIPDEVEVVINDLPYEVVEA